MNSNNGVAASQANDEVLDGILRLAPFDGMFLRAGHLTRIEDYAHDLSQTAAQAGGGGTVHGFTVSLPSGQPQVLRVDAGLAVTGAGAVLELRNQHDQSLPSVTAGATLAWIVEAVPGTRPEGDPELVYGQLCDDGDSGQGPQRPLIAEGVIIRYTALTVTDLGSIAPEQLRSTLAGIMFAREQQARSSLLTGDLSGAPWSSGTPARADDTVPLAVLLRLNEQWYVDPWMVRRDRIEPPPEREWQWRLGMRPRDVFLAQVLQFQTQLGELTGIAVQAAAAVGPDAGISPDAVQRLAESVRQVGGDVPEEAKEVAVQAIEGLSGPPGSLTATGVLAGRGFVDLPPAGFLSLPTSLANRPDVQAYIRALLGPAVTPSFFACDERAVADRFWAAQHLDRISLTAAGQGVPPTHVDVLVPGHWVLPAGSVGAAVLEPATAWVAFARQGRVDPEPATTSNERDRVGVYATEVPSDKYGEAVSSAAQNPPPASDLIGEVSYPHRGFGAPDPSVHDRIKTILEHTPEVTVIALAREDDDIPITALRAALLVLPFWDVTTIHLRVAKLATMEEPAVRVIAQQPPSSPD